MLLIVRPHDEPDFPTRRMKTACCSTPQRLCSALSEPADGNAFAKGYVLVCIH